MTVLCYVLATWKHKSGHGSICLCKLGHFGINSILLCKILHDWGTHHSPAVARPPPMASRQHQNEVLRGAFTNGTVCRLYGSGKVHCDKSAHALTRGGE
eukprot:2368092-Amphidinium_carterae.1